MSKHETKAIIRKATINIYQEMWHRGKKGRHLYIEENVGRFTTILRKKEESIITRLCRSYWT